MLMQRRLLEICCSSQALGTRKQRNKAQQWRQQQLLMSVVHAWEDHTLYKLDRQRQQRRAVRHR